MNYEAEFARAFEYVADQQAHLAGPYEKLKVGKAKLEVKAKQRSAILGTYTPARIVCSDSPSELKILHCSA